MTAVDDLREAAKLLRERAQAATPGPWCHVGENATFNGCGEVVTVHKDLWGGEIAAPHGDLYPRSGYSPQDDMVWIASMHPLVGVALAELLDHVAEAWAGVDDTYPEHEADLYVAVRLARAYLGRSS